MAEGVAVPCSGSATGEEEPPPEPDEEEKEKEEGEEVVASAWVECSMAAVVRAAAVIRARVRLWLGLWL